MINTLTRQTPVQQAMLRTFAKCAAFRLIPLNWELLAFAPYLPRRWRQLRAYARLFHPNAGSRARASLPTDHWRYANPSFHDRRAAALRYGRDGAAGDRLVTKIGRRLSLHWRDAREIGIFHHPGDYHQDHDGSAAARRLVVRLAFLKELRIFIEDPSAHWRNTTAGRYELRGTAIGKYDPPASCSRP
jgi:hypothetical protein